MKYGLRIDVIVFKKEIIIRGDILQTISAKSSPYIIAEIGSNHNQDMGLAKELIHISAECGADAVKFQSLNLSQQYAQEAQDGNLKNLFKQIELDEAWYPILADEARKAGVAFCSAPTYPGALRLLEEVNIPFYKLGSPQIKTFPSLIKQVAALQKPVVLSVGYCNYAEIERAVEICNLVDMTV